MNDCVVRDCGGMFASIFASSGGILHLCRVEQAGNAHGNGLGVLHAGSFGSATNCVFARNAFSGVSARWFAAVELAHCEVAESGSVGIHGVAAGTAGDGLITGKTAFVAEGEDEGPAAQQQVAKGGTGVCRPIVSAGDYNIQYWNLRDHRRAGIKTESAAISPRRRWQIAVGKIILARRGFFNRQMLEKARRDRDEARRLRACAAALGAAAGGGVRS